MPAGGRVQPPAPPPRPGQRRRLSAARMCQPMPDRPGRAVVRIGDHRSDREAGLDHVSQTAQGEATLLAKRQPTRVPARTWRAGSIIQRCVRECDGGLHGRRL
jgi:hypothetical protein